MKKKNKLPGTRKSDRPSVGRPTVFDFKHRKKKAQQKQRQADRREAGI